MRKLLIVALLLAGCSTSKSVSPTHEVSTSTTGANPLDRRVPSSPGTFVNGMPPGAYNPNVTQANISSTICVRGWTKTVRPPVSFTDALKRQQIAALHYTDTNPADYEEDHFVPLELGGAPADPNNLWPQPHTTSGLKDALENRLHKAVCSGQMTLDLARKNVIVPANWHA